MRESEDACYEVFLDSHYCAAYHLALMGGGLQFAYVLTYLDLAMEVSFQNTIILG